MARLPNGDKTGPKSALRTSIDTLRATLLLPATTEHRKLPKDTTTLLTTMHTSLLKFTTPDNLLTHRPNSYATLMKTPAANANSNKRPAIHLPESLPTPDASNLAPLHIMEIIDHKTLLHKTIYRVKHLKTYHLTAKHICQHFHSGFTPEHLARIHPDDEDTPILDIPFKATWKEAWLPEDIARSLLNGNTAIHNYNIGKLPLKKKRRTAPPTPPHRQCGWLPCYITYTTYPINPDMDTVPTGAFEITSHPTSVDSVLLHAPDGRLISTITKARLRKLSNTYHSQDTKSTFPEALSEVILRHKATTYKETFTNERKLHKQQKQNQQLEYEEPCHIHDTLYDTLCKTFKIKRVIHCSPMTLPLRSKEYISHDPRDATFGALLYTKSAWSGASLTLPSYKTDHLTTALEQAMYSAHAHRHTQPSSHILILPNWQPSPYLARNLHSTYSQKLTSIPYLQPHNTQKHNHNTKLNIYLVANKKALRLLDHDYVTHNLHETLSTLLDRDPQPITLNHNLKDPAHLDISQAYKDPYPSIPMKTYTNNPP
jgi:hypothetical protein